MQQSTIGVLALSIVIVFVVALASSHGGLMTTNTHPSAYLAEVGTYEQRGYSSAPVTNSAPATNTAAPTPSQQSSDKPSTSDKKTTEVTPPEDKSGDKSGGSKQTCLGSVSSNGKGGVVVTTKDQQACDTAGKTTAKADQPLTKSVSCTVDAAGASSNQVKAAQKAAQGQSVQVGPGAKGVCVISAKECNEQSGKCKAEIDGSEDKLDVRAFQSADGNKYNIDEIQKRIASGQNVSPAEGNALEEYELASNKQTMDKIWNRDPTSFTASDGQTYDINDIQKKISSGVNVSAPEGAALEEYELKNGGNRAQAQIASNGGSTFDNRMGLGGSAPNTSGNSSQGSSAPTTNGQSNPVHSGGGGVNPAASGGTAGVGGSGAGGNYGPLSGGYDSFKQFQPYGGSNNGLGRIADSFGQQSQPYGGYNQNYGNAYTQPTATAGRGGLGGAIGNFINNLVGNNNSAPTPAPAQGVVFYGGQPVASYTTKDGSIVIDKVRVPRQTPQGNSATPEDLVQALSANDVSVAARIRSEVASGTLTLAIPSGGDGTNQAYTNIQNLIVEDEVQAALQIAEDAGIAAKDSVNCEVNEAASDCLARRIATAQEVERRVFVDELHRRALEPNAVAHFVGVYDNVANPGSGQQYSGASQSVLAQLNNPSTSVVGTVVDAVGAAIDSVVSFIANLF